MYTDNEPFMEMVCFLASCLSGWKSGEMMTGEEKEWMREGRHAPVGKKQIKRIFG